MSKKRMKEKNIYDIRTILLLRCTNEKDEREMSQKEEIFLPFKNNQFQNNIPFVVLLLLIQFSMRKENKG